MRTLSRERLVYAGLAFGVVFASYLWTLAPTLTFWDAGEFITTAKILGIPHPPGTPLFVILGHVFGLLPLGLSFAVKMNVMSALVSAIGCFFYFLVLASVIGRMDRARGWDLPPRLVNAGAFAAVLVGAWGQTQWSNSTETEVYSVALATIALVTFLVFYWADHLEEGKDWNLLLLVVFLMGLSIGNHLMALLVMPAVVVYVLMTVWDRYRDYVLSLLVGAFGLYVTVMRGFSVDGILMGESFINPAALLAGLVALGIGLWWMSRTGALPFFAGAVLLFVAGASVIFFLKIRAGLDPAVNEANPETWKELLAVLARKQYAVRPILPRTVDFLRFQIPLYFDYLFGMVGPFESRTPGQFGRPFLSIVVTLLAVVGSVFHFRADRRTWVYFLLVFLMTSLGLLVYLNFPLGNSQALDVAGLPREVRERDYFFVVSYVFLGMWAGVGVFGLLGTFLRSAGRRALARPALAGATVALMLLPAAVFALNYHEADRSGNYIPRDFAYNVLQSVEPGGILFTNGDNDTFPLWYLQEVEGIRRDVAIVNLALMNTTWYLEQLSEKAFTAGNPPEVLDSLPLAERRIEVPEPDRMLIDYTGQPDDPLSRIGIVVDEPVTIDVAGIELSFPANAILRRQDIAVLQVIRKNMGRRPIYFSVTVPDDAKVGLRDYLVREGIVDRIHDRPASELARGGEQIVPMQPPETAWINIPRTDKLLTEVYLYRGVQDEDVFKDPTARALIGNYGATFLQLASAYARVGDTAEAVQALERGNAILGRDPLDDAYLNSLINVFALSGSYRQLDSLLLSAQERSGGRLDDRLYKTAAYNAAVVGHYDVADRLLEKYFRETPRAVEPELWIEMAEMALSSGDTADAMTLLTRAIRVDPDSRRAFLRYINLADAIGNEILTKTFLYQWVRTHPGDTATARIYERFLDTGRFPEELRWDSIVQGSPAAVDSVPVGE
ncbi:MAG: protein O-mannosyl-transferase family [Gemmatimonadota bacterium]